MMRESDVANEILASLYRLGETYEDYDVIIQRIRILPDPKCETAWMSARCVLGFNPKFMAGLPRDQFDGVVEHELKHYADGHFKRCADLRRVIRRMDSKRWNVATDLEINSKVKNLPTWVCWPKSYGFEENLLAEEYYMLLESHPNGGKGGGMADDLRSADGSTEISDEDASIQDDILTEVEASSVGRGKGKGNGKDEVKLKRNLPIDIHSYLRVMASNMSRTPTFGFEDVNYCRFGKSAIPSILSFAANTFQPIIKLAFIVDTSGSRTNEQVNKSISKIVSTLQNLEAEDAFADMFEVDDGVQRITRIRTVKDVPKTFSGRGGTRLAGAYDEFKINYDLVIVMTDGFIYWGEFDTIPAKYRSKTVFGIDERSYFSTYSDCKFPVFML